MGGEESPDNKGYHTSEREDVREGIEAEKKITSCLHFGKSGFTRRNLGAGG
jgi:hypothetical protein